MTIRKIALAATILLTSITCTLAQSRGMWSGGAKLNIYSRWGGATGIGVYGRYGLGSGFRIEPSFVILCKKGMSVDISGDLQYPIAITRGVELYPLVGVSINDPGRFGLGMNFGGGVGYMLTNRVNLDFGVKWIAQTQQSIANPVVFSFGGGYKF